MQRGRFLLAVAAAILPSICQANIPLASTAAATGTRSLSDRIGHFNESAVGASVSTESKRKGLKPSLSVPKLWGRSNSKKSETPTGGDDTKDNEKESTPNSNSQIGGEDGDDGEKDGESETGQSDEVEKEEGTQTSDVASPSSSDSSNDGPAAPLDKEETPQSQSTGDGEAVETEQQNPEAQSVNQTRSTVLYLPSGPMPMMPHPHARPMTYPYVPQQQQQQQQPRQNTPPSLLSSLLSVLLPRPQNAPPPPYGPPMPPSYAPGGGGGNSNNAVLSLALRLVLLSASTFLLDLLGAGSRSDAFLPAPAQHYTFERVNDRYRRDRSALRQALESPPPGVPRRKWKRAFGRRRREAARSLSLAERGADEQEVALPSPPPSLGNGELYGRTVVILHVKPDARVGNGVAEQLRDAVTFLIEQHRDHADGRNLGGDHHGLSPPSRRLLSSRLLPPYSSSHRDRRTRDGIRPALGEEVEVVLLLDSPGGTVHDYGLASSHLSRLRDEPRVTLSVCVDRVAASGGYMMACQATPGHLFAAPFAMVGSIGVIMETINVNDVLKKYGVRPLVIKAGKNKAPLKTLGEVTPEEMKMAQDDATSIHEAFQEWVTRSRPNVVASKDWLERVCTGAVFLGKEARELGLVDRVLTSDEYVAERIAAGDRVLRLMPYRGPQFGLKISPLDLLLSGMDAEGRANVRQRIRSLGTAVVRHIAPLFRVGAAVGVLNHLASLHSQNPEYRWAA